MPQRGGARSTLAACCPCEGDPTRRCSVVTGDWVARAQAFGGTFGPRSRLRDLRQVYADLLVGYAVEQMPDQVQPRTAFVVSGHNVPRRLWRVRGFEHALVCSRIIPPAPH